MYKGSHCHLYTERAPRQQLWPSVGQYEMTLQGESWGINTLTLPSLLPCPVSAPHGPDPTGRPRADKVTDTVSKGQRPRTEGREKGGKENHKEENHKLSSQSQVNSPYLLPYTCTGTFPSLDQQGH